MATIVIGVYMVRYPLGGNLSWALQYITGFKQLGHEVYVVEKYVHEDACYDPVQRCMTNDATRGIKIVGSLLKKYDLENNWCFVEYGEIYHGLGEEKMKEVFKRADVFIENGSHGVWYEEADASDAIKVFLDVDPAFTQIKMYHKMKAGTSFRIYDYYFTNGMNVGKEDNIIPECGINWNHFFNPVNVSLFDITPSEKGSAYSTIMNWVSYNETVTYQDVTYGHKSIEFEKFIELPPRVNVPIEIAVTSMLPPKKKELSRYGWNLLDAQEVTRTVDSFWRYLQQCRGEFSVVKNMYHATHSGWFSDKSAAFLAGGRPVILQSTGFDDYLPTGEGLFSVDTIEEAAESIMKIERDYPAHSKRAREIAVEFLDTKVVLTKLLNTIGI